MTKEKRNSPKARVYVMGMQYEVPAGLTIMKAMEYVGYRFIRGSGCRGGFCGACATIYRMKDDYKLRFDLACQKVVEDGMFLALIPFSPAIKATYDIEQSSPSANAILEHYPETSKCICCNTCTKACPQNIEVMEYVQAALRGDFEEAAHLSFDCIHCGLCALRCPAGIVPYNVAQLARRLYGRYVLPPVDHVDERVEEIEQGKFDEEMARLTNMSVGRLRKMYEKREIEK